MRQIALLLALTALAGCQNLAAHFNPPPPDAAQPPPPPPPPPPAAPVDPLTSAGLEKISFTVAGPLEDAIRSTAASDIAAPLAQVTARLLIWWVDVQRGMRKGDTLDVVFQRVPNRDPVIHALRFYSGKNAQEYRAFLFKPEGGRFGRYYDAQGVEVEERLQGGPIDDYEQVTSMLRDGRRHHGVDFKTPVGTAVKMPFDATLTRKNWSFRGNGNCLEFHDHQGRRIVFLHLSELPRTLQPGQRFKAGEVVASSGNSGHSTAPHLHYQLEAPSGKLLDPFKVHTLYRARLEGGQLAAYQAVHASYERMLEFQPGSAPTAAAAAPPTAPQVVAGAEPTALPTPTDPVAPPAPAPGPAAAPAPAPSQPSGAGPEAGLVPKTP